MIQPKKKTCACGYTGFFWGKKCNKCKSDESRKKAKAKPKPPKKAWRYTRKPTGEMDVFQRIWGDDSASTEGYEQHRKSFVSNVFLGSVARSWFFSHILPKGRYPEARLDEENIVLMTLEEHELWENHQYKLIDDPKWRHVFLLKHKLLKKYGYAIPPREEHIR